MVSRSQEKGLRDTGALHADLVMRGEDPLRPITVPLAMWHLTNTVQTWA